MVKIYTNCPICGKLRQRMAAHLLWCQCDSCPHRVFAEDLIGREIPPGCTMGHWEATREGRARGSPPGFPCLDLEATLEGTAPVMDDNVTPELDFDDPSWIDMDVWINDDNDWR